MKMYKWVLLLSFGMMVSCGDESPSIQSDDPSIETQGDFEDFNEIVLDFAYQAFLNLNQSEEDNLLISPLSIESALYMTMNGTDGKTLEEFRTALLAQTFYPNGINNHYKTLVDKLSPVDNRTTVSLSNTVFFDDQWVDLEQDFIDVIDDVFEAKTTNADFSDPATVDLINDWAKDKTEGKIEEVLEEIKKDEVLFLINALYMLADWEIGFDPDLTHPKTFKKSNGTQVQVPFMSSDDNRNFVVNSEYSAIDLPFKGEDYSMTFVLPQTDVDQFIGGFDLASMREWVSGLYNEMQMDRVQLSIPKFEIANKLLLKDMLIEMGMETVFLSANLDRMGQFYGGQTYLSRVIHDAFLKVDEKGIEGAAVTTVGVGNESLPPQVTLDRPFLFIIRHVETNTPVFIGRLGDPS
jgi:serpin B